MTKAALSVSQDPKTPDFVQDPYRFYAAMHRASPVFFWEEYGMWCAAGYDQVNALLRDRRLGRENRWGAPLNPVEGREHLTDFDRIESGSLLEREPPAHTRLRTLVNRAFVSRSVERLRPRISTLGQHAGRCPSDGPACRPAARLRHADPADGNLRIAWRAGRTRSGSV
jgi:cytochrome P450